MKASKEDIAGALMSLGYEIDRNWKFCLRDENTPSAVINNDGTIHDFGSGWHGDLISLLQEFEGWNLFGYAKKEAQRLLGLEVEIDFKDFVKKEDEKDTRSLPDKFMVSHRIDARNNRQAYLHELKLLFQGCYNGEKECFAPWVELLKVAQKYDIGFNKKSGRLIMPIRGTDGKIRTFWKYKALGASFVTDDGKEIPHRKVLYTKNRVRPPFAVLDLMEYTKEPNEPVLITEGEKDAMAAIANGQRAICIGGAGASKKLDKEYLDLFKGLKVILAGDYDKAGHTFNKNLSEQLEPIVKSLTVLNWEDKARKDGFKLCNKFDLADYFTWKNHFNKMKIRVMVHQVIAKEVEVELNVGQSIEDIDISTFYKDGEVKYTKYAIKGVNYESV